MFNLLSITGIILEIIGDFKRIAGKNNWKFKNHNRLVPSGRGTSIISGNTRDNLSD